jgi:hypothetical protein
MAWQRPTRTADLGEASIWVFPIGNEVGCVGKALGRDFHWTVRANTSSWQEACRISRKASNDMAIDKKTATVQIDSVLGSWAAVKQKQSITLAALREALTLLCDAINRLAPPGSAYVKQMEGSSD